MLGDNTSNVKIKKRGFLFNSVIFWIDNYENLQGGRERTCKWNM